MAAIPTRYNGIQFRSRLEARWAAYLDQIPGVKWLYEPVDLPGWIPDFSIDIQGDFRPVLAEVKPITDLKRFFDDGHIKKLADAWTDDWCDDNIWRNYDQGYLVLGESPWNFWSYQPHRRVFIRSPSPSRLMQQRWMEAGNRTQWKAPA